MVSFKSTAAAASCLVAATAQNVSAAVNIEIGSSGGNSTSGHQYGFLHEDINNSGDGGIYAELVRNRAFQYSEEFPISLIAYYPINGASLDLTFLGRPLSDQLPASMRVAGGNASGQIGFENEGWYGMDVKQAHTYTGSFWVRGAYDGVFTASLQSNLTDDVFGSVEVESEAVADEWTEHHVVIQPDMDAPNSNNTFAITFDAAGADEGFLDFNLISLFPPTFMGRENGLRMDIAQILLDFHPTFFRIPGGNMLEGTTNATIWDWKDSIGPLRYRPGFPSPWGYQQTHGLGLLEYLQWSEDFEMELVVGVWAGLALNGDITPEEELFIYIEDALNEIEFIRGPADSPWGSRRAELGHPEPFKLEWVEVGNEDWLAGGDEGWQTYQDYRFPRFQQAILEAYPDIRIISSGATTDGYPNTYDIPQPALGDYHPYREPDALVEEFRRFDNETISHIVGEVASTHPNGGIGFDGEIMDFPFWIGAVGEAVSMIGYERNADVPGTFYAPILRHMDSTQWAVTMVQFAADPALTTASVSWYVWELFANHPISETLPVTDDYGPVYYGAGRDAGRDDALVWKGAVYNTTSFNTTSENTTTVRGPDVPITLQFDDVEEGTEATLTVLTNPSGDPFAMNIPGEENMVLSTTYMMQATAGGMFEFSMPEHSVAVLDTDTSRAAGEGMEPPQPYKRSPRAIAGKPPGYRPAW